MQPVTISQIVDQVHKLSADQLASVFDFVSHLADDSESLQTMLVSEHVLRKDWDKPEEDAAWRNL